MFCHKLASSMLTKMIHHDKNRCIAFSTAKSYLTQDHCFGDECVCWTQTCPRVDLSNLRLIEMCLCQGIEINICWIGLQSLRDIHFDSTKSPRLILHTYMKGHETCLMCKSHVIWVVLYSTAALGYLQRNCRVTRIADSTVIPISCICMYRFSEYNEIGLIIWFSTTLCRFCVLI